jgi:hypothetical protein
MVLGGESDWRFAAWHHFVCWIELVASIWDICLPPVVSFREPLAYVKGRAMQLIKKQQAFCMFHLTLRVMQGNT